MRCQDREKWRLESDGPVREVQGKTLAVTVAVTDDLLSPLLAPGRMNLRFLCKT
jgi:hypothetical protein